jgi:hypothetical protein
MGLPNSTVDSTFCSVGWPPNFAYPVERQRRCVRKDQRNYPTRMDMMMMLSPLNPARVPVGARVGRDATPFEHP